MRANDLYENVMYDKTIRFANGEYIVLMQDDDEITDLDWWTKVYLILRNIRIWLF